MIPWEHAEPARVERAVKALLRRRYPGLRSLDGSGGDGGRDAQLVTADGTTAFEVKSFTARLTAGRRRQVEQSLRSAVANVARLRRWVLILPRDMTPQRPSSKSSEEAWFDGHLAALAPGVHLQWWGRDWLDGQFAQDMALQRMVEGPDAQLLHRAAEFDREQAVMASGGADLLARNAILRSRVDEVSAFWTWDWQVQRDTQIFTLREQFPGAAEQDPITLLPTFAFPREDPEALQVHDQLSATLDFGGTVEVPGRYLTAFEVQVSAETRALLAHRDGLPDSVLIHSAEHAVSPPLLGSLDVVDPEGATRGSLPLRFVESTSGAVGVRLRAVDAAEHLTVELSMAKPEGTVAAAESADCGGRSAVHVALREAAGHQPEALQPAVDLLSLAGGGDILVVRVGDAELLRSSPLEGETPFPFAAELQPVVAALMRLQRHVGSALPFPPELTVANAELVTALAGVLDGRHVPTGKSSWRLRLRPERVQEFLAKMPADDTGQLLLVWPDLELQLGERRVSYGPLAQHGPHLRLANRAELERHNGRDPVRAVFEPCEAAIYWLPREQAEQLSAASPPRDGSQPDLVY